MRRGLAGIEPTPARPNGAGYAHLNLSRSRSVLVFCKLLIAGSNLTSPTRDVGPDTVPCGAREIAAPQ